MYDKETVEKMINTLKAGVIYLQMEGKDKEAKELLEGTIENLKEVIKRIEEMITNLKGGKNE